MTMINTLTDTGHRLTGPRLALASLIDRQPGHFTASSLLEQARGHGLRLGRASVFRTLDLLAELGALEHIDLPDGEHAYVACEPAHHHHVICQSCGRVTEVADAGLAAAVAEMSRRSGWKIDSHRLELFGYCPRCHQ
jgi:Fur family ferric uptake transcriptional regulator